MRTRPSANGSARWSRDWPTDRNCSDRDSGAAHALIPLARRVRRPPVPGQNSVRIPRSGISPVMSEQPLTTSVTLRPLALTNRRAVGGPVSLQLLAAYFAVALVGWLAATVAAAFAAGDLAAGRPLAAAPVLAVHLVALGVLPFVVSGASFHLLPVMLRNDLPSQRALWLALPLLAGGFLVASGLGREAQPIVWAGAAMVACGLAIVLAEVLTLVVRAPRGRTLIASRLGVALCLHARRRGALSRRRDLRPGPAVRRPLLSALVADPPAPRAARLDRAADPDRRPQPRSHARPSASGTTAHAGRSRSSRWWRVCGCCSPGSARASAR